MENMSCIKMILAISLSLAVVGCDQSPQSAQSKSPEKKANGYAASKIDVPNDFPRDLPLPHTIQLESYEVFPGQNSAILEGLLEGEMTSYVAPLNQMMQQWQWQANIVVPQTKNTLMHFTKSDRSVVIELIRVEDSDGELTRYSVTYAPVSS